MQASTTLTPSVQIGLGYDDNIDMERDPTSDFFIQAGVGLNMLHERPGWDFLVDGYVNYDHYFAETNRSRLDTAGVMLRYRYEPSPSSLFTIFNHYRQMNNFEQEGAGGELVRIRPGESRQVNTTGVRFTDSWGPKSNWYAGYKYDIANNEFEESEDSRQHSADAGVAWEYAPQWVLALDAFYLNTDWESSADTWRGGGNLTWSHMFGPDMTGNIGLGYEKASSGDDDPLSRRLNDYELYRVSVGWDHEHTRVFGYGLSVGMVWVEGAQETNSAAGQSFYTYNISAHWKGTSWGFNIYASHDLADYDTYNDNSGLTRVYRMGADFLYELSPRWNFSAGVAYIRDEPQMLSEIVTNGDLDSYRATGALTWKTSQNTTLGLQYTHLTRDGELDTDDRYRNRLLLVFTATNPFRW